MLLIIINNYSHYYSYLKNNKDNERKENTLKEILTIAKKHPVIVINNDKIKNSYYNILPSNHFYSEESKKYIYILLKEMIKEGIIKKRGHGSEIIVEIIFIRHNKEK